MPAARQTRGTKFRLQLVGDTNWGFSDANPFSRKVDSLVAELVGLGVEVIRLGHLPRPEIADALSQSDIHVIPSRWDEPLGLTMLEGLASGQAVIGSATGGTPELLEGAGTLPARGSRGVGRPPRGAHPDPEARVRGDDGPAAGRNRSRGSDLAWHRTGGGPPRDVDGA